MSPYRISARPDEEPGPHRPSAVRRFAEGALLAVLIILVVLIRTIAMPFTGEHPLDF